MKTYKGDPRKITTRFNSTCANCGCRITKGTTAYYWPHGNVVFCSNCGEPEFREFISMATDEEAYY